MGVRGRRDALGGDLNDLGGAQTLLLEQFEGTANFVQLEVMDAA